MNVCVCVCASTRASEINNSDDVGPRLSTPRNNAPSCIKHTDDALLDQKTSAIHHLPNNLIECSMTTTIRRTAAHVVDREKRVNAVSFFTSRITRPVVRAHHIPFRWHILRVTTSFSVSDTPVHRATVTVTVFGSVTGVRRGFPYTESVYGTGTVTNSPIYWCPF